LLEAEEWVPQLAIVDVQLPRMNGIELAIALNEQYPEVQMVLFSGRGTTAELLEEAQKRGHYFDILAKPVHPAVLLGMASKLLGDEG
jgi:DNA-binding NtrC family response regulator